MAEKIALEVVTPERRVLGDDVEAVYAPGFEGEFGVLPGHAPLLCLLRIGELRYYKNGDEIRLAISGGFAEVDQERMRVLAETAEFSEEIDVDRAEAAKSRAEKRLEEIDPSERPDDFSRAELALKRALIRLQVAGR
jgi:F-type H+-transporting ATPase subunit epsilon